MHTTITSSTQEAVVAGDSDSLLTSSTVGTLLTFGGGSSDHQASFAPGEVINATPPAPPIRGADLSQGESGCDCICNGNLYSFSAMTCLSLLKRGLLTNADLLYEREYLNSLGHKIDISDDIDTCKNELLSILENQLNIHNCVNIAYQTKQVNRLTSSISYLAETVEAETEKVRRGRVLPTPPSPATTQRSAQLDEPSQDNADTEVNLDISVCDLFDAERVNFSDVSVRDVLSQITVNTPASGNRLTAYFGDLPYRYGRIKHDARPYPQRSIFSTIFEKVQKVVPDFSPTNYTCLINFYPSGNSQIRFHSDDEQQIQPDSSIITISLRSARTITFQNQSGAINEAHIKLPHGSVFAMSRSSQATWKHCIKPDASIEEPRVSFTFRRLLPESDIPTPPRAPPITHPDEYRSKKSPPHATHHGILLLTDSILSPTPEHIFDKIKDHRCIKKVNKRLVDIFGFEPEFRYRKTVVISCGVNDLSCYGLRAHSLADIVCARLAASCRQHHGTTFIYNSMLYTGHGWLNDEIEEFNRIMFELSLEVPNLFFFDSSSVIEQSPLKHRWSDVIERSDSRRIHITLAARRLITDQLVNGVDYVCRGRDALELRSWNWPLRPHFASKLVHFPVP